MKKSFAFLFCAATLAGFAGCSDDDDDKADLSQLIGKWECYKDYDGEYDIWNYEYGEGSDIYRYEFRTDGTGARRTDDRNDVWIPFAYALSGNVLAIVDQRYEDTEQIRIEKLTSSELILAYDYEGDDGRSCTDKEYFKRIQQTEQQPQNEYAFVKTITGYWGSEAAVASASLHLYQKNGSYYVQAGNSSSYALCQKNSNYNSSYTGRDPKKKCRYCAKPLTITYYFNL